MKGFVAYPKEELNLGKIYEKYRNGDDVSDEELKFGIKEFGKLADGLSELGAVFALPWKEIWYIKNGLEDMQKARRKK